MNKHKKQKAAKVASLTQMDETTASQLRHVGSKRNIENIVVRPSTLYLTDAEVAEVEALRFHLEHLRAESEKRELARAFRIFDLPPEIRVRIYRLFFQEADKYRGDSTWGARILARTFAPPITRVCGTFRKECLPIFFATTKFAIPVLTNLVERTMCRTVPHVPCRRSNRCGKLNFKRPAKKAIRDAGNDAVFRDITFRLYEDLYRGSWRCHSRFLYLDCNITFRKGRLQVNLTQGGAYPTVLSQVQGLNVMIEQIRHIAADLETKEDCKGLKLNDLERMAKVFCFKCPEKVAKEDQEGRGDTGSLGR